MVEISRLSEGDRWIIGIDEYVRSNPLWRLRILELEAMRLGWRSGYRQWLSTWSHWVDPSYPNHFPATTLATVIRVTGGAPFLDDLLALEQREQRKIRGRESERSRGAVG